MSVRQYIGARYVPKFFENDATNDSTWAENTPYEPLTIVTWNNFSYTSKKQVPATVGAPNLNTDYWVLTGDYSGSIASVLSRLDDAEHDIDEIESDIATLEEHEEYFLYPTGDNTDRKAEVLQKLTTYGVCFFTAGDFYMSSGLIMPAGTSIMGMGEKTALRLTGNGTLITMREFCRVENVKLIGQNNELPYSSYTAGSNIGIYIDGDAVNFSTPVTYAARYTKISNVTIQDFNNSGIKIYGTDGAGGCKCVNSLIMRCVTGLNIPFFSEFNSFTNLDCKWCNVGIVMQGGNNIFTSCHFITNLNCLIIDGLNNSLVNPGHSVFVGCILAHTYNDQGNLIDIKNLTNGIEFVGCSLWYGNIIINNSPQVSIESCIIGIQNLAFNISGCIGANINDNHFMCLQNQITWTLTGAKFCFENNFDSSGNIMVHTASFASNNTVQAKYLKQGSITFTSRGVGVAGSTRMNVAIPIPFIALQGYNITVDAIVICDVAAVSPIPTIQYPAKLDTCYGFEFAYAGYNVTAGKAYIVEVTLTLTAAN